VSLPGFVEPTNGLAATGTGAGAAASTSNFGKSSLVFIYF
jgi:hypothetical protein